MDKNALNETLKKTAGVTGKAVKIGLGLSLICLNVAATVVGALVFAVTSQD